MPENEPQVPVPEPEAAEKSSWLQRYKDEIIVGVAVVGVIACVGFLGNYFASGDGKPNPKPNDIPEKVAQPNTLAPPKGVTLEEILEATSQNGPKPKVLRNFELSRIISGDYVDGSTTAELVTIKTETCMSPDGTTFKPESESISRIVFRNSLDGSTPYLTAELNKEHIEKTEELRTQYMIRQEADGNVQRKADGFTYDSKQSIGKAVAPEVCGNPNAKIVEPEITSHRLLIDSATYDNVPSYAKSGSNGSGDTKDKLALVGLAMIGLGVYKLLKFLRIAK